MPEQRTICLIPIPFSDFSSVKKRPVLIISNDVYCSENEDILVMALTSNLSDKKYSLMVMKDDMESGELLHDSLIRADKIYSIKKSFIIKSFGKLNQKKFDESINLLLRLIK